MRSSSRLIVGGLKESDFKCSPVADDKLICDDCGKEMAYALQLIGKRAFCKDCSPWYKEQFELDAIALEADLLRDIKKRPVEETEAELDYGERDYWD
jgi:CO dehydrogenase/acetyl-CoA synthase gamma subunit (corrinoid Fe-S protein)